MITHHQVQQGTQEWLDLRCGLLTASEMHLIMTPKLKTADNDKSRAHLYELLAQRITKHVEPHYISDDMLRGHGDEVRAREMYAETYPDRGEVSTAVGFITREFTHTVDENTIGGGTVTFTIGYSPDALVGERGQWEGKSRRQKYQVQTILGVHAGIIVPEEYALQVQTGLLVTGRDWCDFSSYSGGLPHVVTGEYPNNRMQERILDAAARFELRMAEAMRTYSYTVAKHGWRMTERTPPNDGEIQLPEETEE